MELIVMRLADMKLVHPDQITSRCSTCGHAVGIYPSGQKILLQYPDTVVTCEVCKSPGKNAILAPGAKDERSQSVRRS